MKYFNEKMFTDVTPYEVVEVLSKNKVRIRAMKAVAIDKPIFDNTAKCINNDMIRYDISSNPEGYELVISKRKNGYWYKVGTPTSIHNTYYYESDEPRKFYDYSF